MAAADFKFSTELSCSFSLDRGLKAVNAYSIPDVVKQSLLYFDSFSSSEIPAPLSAFLTGAAATFLKNNLQMIIFLL